MERNQLIGFILLFGVLFAWTLYNAPSEEEMKRAQIQRDSMAAVKAAQDSLALVPSVSQEVAPVSNDSTVISAKEEIVSLENDDIKIDFSTKGGVIKDVWVKKYKKSAEGKDNEEVLSPLHLMDDKKNRFEYLIGSPDRGSIVSTQDLIFSPTVSGNSIILSTNVNGGVFTQEYNLAESGYNLDYNIATSGVQGITEDAPLRLHWLSYLGKLEKNDLFEQRYSTIYFKEADATTADYCSCTMDDTEDMDNRLDWISYSNQFFNSTLISSDRPFKSAKMETQATDLEKSKELKRLDSYITTAVNASTDRLSMKMYLGPNEFERLSSYDLNVEQIIPYGNSIFGSINRWLIRPFFNFLTQFIGSKGLVIILLIFLIKMALYPLMYKMLKSQALMGTLKPEIAKLKEKNKDDLQKQQMETMKLYREYGVSPLGGCLPMFLQMPIWYALFRFFPASITFRQESFLWASDLSSYDSFFNLPFEIPFIGDHLSLFTILWAISTLIYTFYNSRNIDMSANPAMQYMQYFMPVMFLGFFNTYASGLTCYMFFSNLMNILMTVITKSFVFDDKKLRLELDQKKAKPKKKSKFQTRLEEAMKQQQALAEQQKKARSKGGKK